MIKQLYTLVIATFLCIVMPINAFSNKNDYNITTNIKFFSETSPDINSAPTQLRRLFRIFSPDPIVSETPLGFELDIKHIGHKIINSSSLLDFKNPDARIEGIYETEKYIDGKKVVIEGEQKNLLDKLKNKNFNYKRFVQAHSTKNFTTLIYRSAYLKLNNILKYRVKASVKLKLAKPDEYQSVVLETKINDQNNTVIISTDDGVLYIKPTKDTITVGNKLVFHQFYTLLKGEEATLNKEEDIEVKVSILDGENEILLDNNILPNNISIKQKKNHIFLPEKYFNKNIRLKIVYPKVEYVTLDIDEEVETNIENF